MKTVQMGPKCLSPTRARQSWSGNLSVGPESRKLSFQDRALIAKKFLGHSGQKWDDRKHIATPSTLLNTIKIN